jgi:hypothetical protein
MTDQTNAGLEEVMEAKSKAIATAVIGLTKKIGYDVDLVAEGALRGASSLLLGRGDSPDQVARLFENYARLVRTLDQNNEA